MWSQYSLQNQQKHQLQQVCRNLSLIYMKLKVILEQEVYNKHYYDDLHFKIILLLNKKYKFCNNCLLPGLTMF